MDASSIFTTMPLPGYEEPNPGGFSPEEWDRILRAGQGNNPAYWESARDKNQPRKGSGLPGQIWDWIGEKLGLKPDEDEAARKREEGAAQKAKWMGQNPEIFLQPGAAPTPETISTSFLPSPQTEQTDPFKAARMSDARSWIGVFAPELSIFNQPEGLAIPIGKTMPDYLVAMKIEDAELGPGHLKKKYRGEAPTGGVWDMLYYLMDFIFGLIAWPINAIMEGI